MINELAKGMQD